jgi:hypothetical protein
MSAFNWADWIVTTEFVVGLLFFLAFAIGYHFSTGGQWRRSPEGRHMMSLSLSLVAVGLLAVLNNVWQDYPARDLGRVAVYAWFAHGGAMRLLLLFRAQRARRRDHTGPVDAQSPHERIA